MALTYWISVIILHRTLRKYIRNTSFAWALRRLSCIISSSPSILIWNKDKVADKHQVSVIPIWFLDVREPFLTLRDCKQCCCNCFKLRTESAPQSYSIISVILLTSTGIESVFSWEWNVLFCGCQVMLSIMYKYQRETSFPKTDTE